MEQQRFGFSKPKVDYTNNFIKYFFTSLALLVISYY